MAQPSHPSGRPQRGDPEIVDALLRQVSADLSLICDRALEFEVPVTERVAEKVPAQGGVHVAFRIEFGDPRSYGCIMLPLSEAATLAGSQLGLRETRIRKLREKEELDRPTKAAMIELSHVICGSIDAALRELHEAPPTVLSAGCQGVREGQRPGIELSAGRHLVAAKVCARIGAFDAFELLVQLPAELFDAIEAGEGPPRIAA